MRAKSLILVAATIALAATLMLASAAQLIVQADAGKGKHPCPPNSPEGQSDKDPVNIHGCGPDHLKERVP